MFYIIYKTTNILDGMYYVGCHQTHNLEDGYIGSGKYLKRAIKKHGAENFVFEVLHFVDSKEKMFDLERQIVNEALVNDSSSYNLKLGGSGGNPGIVGVFAGRKHSDDTKNKLREAAKKLKSPFERSVEKYGYAEACRRNGLGNKYGSKGIPKSQEHKEKLRAASIKNKSGKKNIGKVREKVVCPHCSKTGALNTMVRWHFNNCKKILSGI